MKALLTGVALATLTLGASAQIYVGGNIGWAKISNSCEDGFSCKDNQVGYRAHIGYNDTAEIAAELGYLNFGSVKFDDGEGLRGKVEAHAMTVGLAFRKEFQPGLKGVLRVGAANVTSKLSANNGFKEDNSTLEPHLGLGLEYTVMPNVQATGALDATRGSTRTGDTGSVFLLSAGMQYQF